MGVNNVISTEAYQEKKAQFEMEIRNKQKRVYNTLSNLSALAKTRIVTDMTVGFHNEIKILNDQEYVPDFRFVWCGVKLHYRVYILVADTKNVKTNAGYCICTISSGLAAAGFVALYSFLHKHRANNKGDAV